MNATDVYMDRDGNWIGVRAFNYTSGAQGYERHMLIRRTHSTDLTDERAEAEARFASILETTR